MAISGDLGSIELASVFQMLLLSQKTGTLAIRTRAGRRDVWFDGESVLLPFDRDAFPTKVLRALQKSGTLSAEQVARAQASLGLVERDLFTILLSMRVITAEQISAAWRTLMEEEIYELFVDRDATFEFREGEAPNQPGKVIDQRYRLSGNSLLMEAARRIDEWSFIRARVPSDRCVLEVASAAAALPKAECDDVMTAVVAGIDGRSPVSAIVDRAGVSRFQVSKKLALLVELRIAYEVPREQLLERARACLREEKAEQGLGLLERALELGAEDPAAHEMAALAHQALGRVGEASRHLGQVAEALERAGNRKAAAEAYLRIRDLLPTDVRCRERLVHHWLDDPAFFKATQYAGEAEALELAAILREIGREDALRALLLELVVPFEKDPRLVGRLADLSGEIGDAKLTVQLLMRGGDALAKAGQPGLAARLYRRIRAVDPQHPGLPEKLAAVDEGGTTRLLASGALMRAVAGLVAMAGIGFALFAYNREAMAAWVALPLEELAIAGDINGAKRELDELRGRYPVSVAALLATGSVRDLELRRQRLEAAERERRELLANDATRRQHIADRAYADALELLKRGERAAAQEQFVRAAEQATDARFLAEMKPAEKAADLAADLAAEAADREAYATARRDGDWQQMRALGLRLADRPGDKDPQAPILLPVRITVDPPDADLAIDPAPLSGEKLRSPAIVLLPAGSSARLIARREGRSEVERTLVAEEAFDVAIRLAQLPERLLELTRRMRFAPAQGGALLYAVCDDGRVVAIDVAELEIRWEKVLPDLDDAAGPATLAGRVVEVTTRKGFRARFDAVTGEPIDRVAGATLAATAPVAAVVPWPGGCQLAAGDGVVQWLDRAGKELSAWKVPGPPEWAVAVEGGALFGAAGWIARIVPVPPLASKSAGGSDR